MSSQLISPNNEADIWARLMQAQEGELSPQAAKYLLSIKFGEHDTLRMRQLAERSQSGALTEREQAEFDSYLHVGNLLAVMQSRARIVLRGVRES